MVSKCPGAAIKALLKSLDGTKHLTQGYIGVKFCEKPDISMLYGISQQYETMNGEKFHLILFRVHTEKP